MWELSAFMESDINVVVVLLGFASIAFAITSFGLIFAKGVSLYLSDVFSYFSIGKGGEYEAREGFL